MDKKELAEILEKHWKWLTNRDGGEPARLNGMDLHGADFYCADLRCADLNGANLCGAMLHGANLENADLCDANLTCADITEANLRETGLRGADLRGADLHASNLYGADLTDADLRDTHLGEANLHRATLPDDDRLLKYFPLCCPEVGAFIGWKKCRGGCDGDFIVKLLIPEDARRSSAFGRKCRCDKAIVLEIQEMDGTEANMNEVRSMFRPSFVYRVGETVTVDNFDTDRTHECALGIHFFITRQEAVEY